MRRIIWTAAAVAAVGLVLATPSAFAEAQYNVTGLGALGPHSYAYDVNDRGQVVGWSGGQAFLWEDGTIYGLGGRWAWAISNDGEVVGTGDLYGFVWDPVNGMQDLSPLPGDLVSDAWGISGHHQIVGMSGDGDRYRAVLWDGDEIQDLGVVPDADYTDSWAYDINDHQQVVGWSGYHHLGRVAFIWDADNGMRQITGGPGAWMHEAWAINNLGQVAGRGRTSDGDRAVLWDSGTIVGLGDWSVSDLNDRTQVVGADSQNWAAVIWDPTNGLQNLNDLIDPASGWRLYWAEGISNAGHICGYGRGPTGYDEAFLLTPIPEPGLATLVGLAFAGLAALRKRSPPH